MANRPASPAAKPPAHNAYGSRQAPTPRQTLVAHMDLDCFYAQVEAKRVGVLPLDPADPTSVPPLAVRQHSMLLATNYSARRKGVKSRGSPTEALASCPELIIVETEMISKGAVRKPSLRRYREASIVIMEILSRFVKPGEFERASIDEVYVALDRVVDEELANSDPSLEPAPCSRSDEHVFMNDLSLVSRRLACASRFVAKMRDAVMAEVGYHLSAGISQNKLLAKIASAKFKPNAQTIVPESLAMNLMREIRLTKVPGFGGKLGRKLRELALYAMMHGAGQPAMSIDDASPSPDAAQREDREEEDDDTVDLQGSDVDEEDADGSDADENNEPDGLEIKHATATQEPTVALIQDGTVSPGDLERVVGKEAAHFVVERACGRDDALVVEKMRPKSLLSASAITYVYERDKLLSWMALHCNELSNRVWADWKRFARSPSSISMHFSVFQGGSKRLSVTRRSPIFISNPSVPTSTEAEIYDAALLLLKRCPGGGIPCSFLGVAVDNFIDVGPGTANQSKMTHFLGNKRPRTDPLEGLDVVVNVNDERSVDDEEESDHLESDEAEEEMEEDDDGEMRLTRMNDDADEQASTSIPGNHASAPLYDGSVGKVVSSLRDARRHNPLLNHPKGGGALTSLDVGAEEFQKRFFSASRLSFIGRWKERFETIMKSLPDPGTSRPPTHLPFNERVIFHIDLDAFFATVAVISRPELAKVPVAVCWGDNSQLHATAAQRPSTSEISSCNYVARKRGLRSGMSLRRALQMCPELVCVPFEFEKYERLAEVVLRQVFEVSPWIQGLSCDEMFVDVTDRVNQSMKSSTSTVILEEWIKALAEDLRSKIKVATGGCTASIGAGPNRLVARIATQDAKPDGFKYVRGEDKVLAYLGALPVTSLPSVGHETAEKLLHAHEARTVADLRRVPKRELEATLGPKLGSSVFEFANGVDSRPWQSSHQMVREGRKSISAQASYGVRMKTLTDVAEFFHSLALRVKSRLVAAGLPLGKEVGIKIWRAIPNQPETHRKGSVGHGICDILQRTTAISSKRRSESASSEDPDVESLFDTAYRLFVETKTPPIDVRGLGLISAGFDGGVSARVAGGGILQFVANASHAPPQTSNEALKRLKRSPQETLNLHLDHFGEDPEEVKRAIAHELGRAFEEVSRLNKSNLEQSLEKCQDALKDALEIVRHVLALPATTYRLDFLNFCVDAAAPWNPHVLALAQPNHVLCRINDCGGGYQFWCDNLQRMIESER